MNRLKIIALAGLGAVDIVAGLFAWRSFVGGETGDSLPARSAPLIVPAAALADAPSAMAGDDPETLARPLFAKSRRPYQSGPRAANVASTAPPPAGLRLRAVVGFHRSVRAFVTSSAAADGKWLSVGEIFENWTVDSIGAQEIALRQDAERLRFGLDYEEVAGPVGTAPPPVKIENPNESPPAKAAAPDAVRGAKRSER